MRGLCETDRGCRSVAFSEALVSESFVELDRGPCEGMNMPSKTGTSTIRPRPINSTYGVYLSSRSRSA